jgi:hypothetical protein
MAPIGFAGHVAASLARPLFSLNVQLDVLCSPALIIEQRSRSRFVIYLNRKKVMAKGAAAVTKPNREIAIPVAFLRLATKSNPNTNSKAPRATTFQEQSGS